MTSSLSLDDFLPYRLSVASNLASAVIAQAYQRLFGLSIGEWRVVALLAEHDEGRQQDLSIWSRMDKMSISRAVRPLVARGLVERLADPGDGRAARLVLTTAGRDLHARVVPAARKLEQGLLAAVSDDERAALDAILRRIETAAIDLLDR